MSNDCKGFVKSKGQKWGQNEAFWEALRAPERRAKSGHHEHVLGARGGCQRGVKACGNGARVWCTGEVPVRRAWGVHEAHVMAHVMMHVMRWCTRDEVHPHGEWGAPAREGVFMKVTRMALRVATRDEVGCAIAKLKWKVCTWVRYLTMNRAINRAYIYRALTVASRYGECGEVSRPTRKSISWRVRRSRVDREQTMLQVWWHP